MELQAIPIMVSQPSGNTKYVGTAVMEAAAGREVLIKEHKHGDPVEHLAMTVPQGKHWSVHVSVEITETAV